MWRHFISGQKRSYFYFYIKFLFSKVNIFESTFLLLFVCENWIFDRKKIENRKKYYSVIVDSWRWTLQTTMVETRQQPQLENNLSRFTNKYNNKNSISIELNTVNKCLFPLKMFSKKINRRKVVEKVQFCSIITFNCREKIPNVSWLGLISHLLFHSFPLFRSTWPLLSFYWKSSLKV